MKTTCLINSHNYRRYVGEAVTSALEQTQAFDEIIIVDDGSSDGSAAYLRQHFGHTPNVHVICKSQGGQLSCFNAGVQMARGDVLFFLDADDRYLPGYLERATDFYRTRPEIDFLSVGYQLFGDANKKKPRVKASRDQGLSTLAALLGRKWIGAATSCLSMRMSLAREILPCPFEPAWQTRADDVLVYGASLVGGRKYQLGDSLIELRDHGSNYFRGRRFDAFTKMQHSLAVNQLIEWYRRKVGYDATSLSQALHREFRTIERPRLKELFGYLAMSWNARMPLRIRCKHALAMTSHMLIESVTRRSPDIFGDSEGISREPDIATYNTDPQSPRPIRIAG